MAAKISIENEMNCSPPVLVLGVGNILLSDEGAGIRVVEEIQKAPLPDFIEVVDGATRGMELSDIMRGRKKVIIVDAVAAGAEPGAVFRFGPQQLEGLSMMSLSVHDIGVHEAIFHLRMTDELPEDIIFYGIQPGSLALREGLTPEVSAATEKVIAFVLEDLKKIQDSL